MIKVLRFIDCEPGKALVACLCRRWEAALATGTSEPGRPSRVAVNEPLSLADAEAPPFGAIELQWFEGVDDALASQDWLAATDRDLGLGASSPGTGTCVILAEEVILRGQDYLEARWRDGGERLKMTSFGKRNPRLTLAEFSAQWRAHAGHLGGEEIPAAIRGLAYVQNHALELGGPEWPFDAVNEVYFERQEDLQRRQAYFAARQDAAAGSPTESFMSPTQRWSMFVRERPVPAPQRRKA